MLPFYNLSDFPDRRSQGRNWLVTCPQCGKRHLYIDKATGKYLCFYSGCNFRGILEDFRTPSSPLSQLQVKATHVSTPARPRTDEPSQLPCTADDYHALDAKLCANLIPLADCQPVVDYLSEQRLSLHAAQAAGCMATLRKFGDKPRHCICYVNRVNGDIVNIKYRAVDAKMFCQDSLPDKDLPSPPYNIDCINPLLVNSDEADNATSSRQPLRLIITEGEKDCITLLSCGYRHVISVPNGASCRPQVFMEPFLDWLQAVSTVVICVDNDRAGRRLRYTLNDYFSSLHLEGRHSLGIAICNLSTACKDISEVHQRYGADEVRRVVDTAISNRPSCVLTVADVSHDLRAYLQGHYDHGFSLGYGPSTDRHLRLTDEGGLIVLTGRPGSGKTDWLRCTLTRLMVTDRPCAFLSFEEPNKAKHVGRIVQVLLGTRNTQLCSDEQLDHVISWLNSRMVNLDMTAQPPTTANIISVATRLIDDGFAMRMLVIDPYLFIDMGTSKENETKLIRDMLTTLQSWGRRHHVWICVVAHPRMLYTGIGGEQEDIDPYKVSGSAHWANLADFLISVKRIFPDGEQTDEGCLRPSYTRVSVLKVRDQDLCATGNIYYMRHPSGRYFEQPSEQACKDMIRRHGTLVIECEPMIEN